MRKSLKLQRYGSRPAIRPVPFPPVACDFCARPLSVASALHPGKVSGPPPNRMNKGIPGGFRGDSTCEKQGIPGDCKGFQGIPTIGEYA